MLVVVQKGGHRRNESQNKYWSETFKRSSNNQLLYSKNVKSVTYSPALDMYSSKALDGAGKAIAASFQMVFQLCVLLTGTAAAASDHCGKANGTDPCSI